MIVIFPDHTHLLCSSNKGIASSIPSRSHSFVEIDLKQFQRSFSALPLNHSRRVIFSYKRKNVHEVLANRLFKLAQEKVCRLTDRPAMTIAVDLGRKQRNKQTHSD